MSDHSLTHEMLIVNIYKNVKNKYLLKTYDSLHQNVVLLELRNYSLIFLIDYFTYRKQQKKLRLENRIKLKNR